MEFFNNAALDHFSAFRIDGVCDICIQFRTPVFFLDRDLFGLTGTALVAKLCPKVVLIVASRAMRSQLTAGHRDERSVRALNDLEVTNDEAIIESNGTKPLEAIVTVFH